ncbi:MAG: Fe(3+) dicitrate transport protein FecA precursor, partial [Pseudomonadota bacterium]
MHSIRRSNRNVRLGQTIVAVAASTLCNSWLFAQTLDEVVISATRSEQRSFDAPAAISVVDRETIQNAGPQINLSESLNRVPGLT